MSTKGNFSRDPDEALTEALSKGYLAAHIEQGVPVLDRDLNLQSDLAHALVRRIIKRYIGDGVAGTTDFAVTWTGSDVAIAAGTYLADGVEINLSKNTTYATQTVPATAIPALPSLTTPSGGPDPRIDTVYIDRWFDEIDENGDAALVNGLDVGIRTSTRIQESFLIRVAENASSTPAPISGHTYWPIAQLRRPLNPQLTTTVIDLRQTVSLGLIESRVSVIEASLAPSIVSVLPSTPVPAGGTVNILGSHLLTGTPRVFAGSTALLVDPTTSTDTSLFVNIPPTAPPGVSTVTVTTPFGQATAPGQVTILVPQPSFVDDPTQQIAPASATWGATITLNGKQSFQYVTGVKLSPVSGFGTPFGATITPLTVAPTKVTFVLPSPPAQVDPRVYGQYNVAVVSSLGPPVAATQIFSFHA